MGVGLETLTFSAPQMLLAGAGVVVLAVLAVVLRRLAIGRGARALLLAGLVLVVLSAAGPTLRWPTRDQVLVMVDLSPSTRTAHYRDAALLQQRIEQLLGPTPFRMLYFAERTAERPPGGAERLADLPAQRTVFQPPSAAAVLLFSDGRFELPHFAPPTHIVIDPGLERPADAAIERLEQRGDQIVAIVRNTGQTRQLTFTGTDDPLPIAIPLGTRAVTARVAADATEVIVRLNPGDAWPENDMMTLALAPPRDLERWWISHTPPPDPRWLHRSPGQLPADALSYLAAGVIALENVSADEMSPLQMERLEQYVRDLGGGLLLIGGDRAFAAGGYPGTRIEVISPLASLPPRPTTHWMLLADSSGSMAAVSQGQTHWQHAVRALEGLIAQLSEQDLLSVGNFARQVNWWSYGRSVAETRRLRFPPADLFPHGPTNLEPALAQIAEEAAGQMPRHLLVLSDAEVEIERPAELAQAMIARNIRLHILAIEDGRGVELLRQLAESTGGSFQREIDPARWPATVVELMRGTLPRQLNEESLPVRYLDEAAPLAGRRVSPWNRTWLRDGAAPLAEASFHGETIHPAARWQVGAGRVLAVAFPAESDEPDTLAALVARPPRDPRLAVSWDHGEALSVVVDAVDEGAYLNELELNLELAPPRRVTGVPQVHRVAQTGPGRYELILPAPAEPNIATLRHQGRWVDQVAVAGRYALEFLAIGNDRQAMRLLAERSGGSVIESEHTGPLRFDSPAREVAVSSIFASTGSLLIAAGLVWWRRQS